MEGYSENAVKAYKNLYLICNENEEPTETIGQCHLRISNFHGDDSKEKDIFKNILDGQVFRVNTPAMANAGVKVNPILSACFIIGLEDGMDSIINMWSSAARIYEGGGGCGIPITNLREQNAWISSGGFASGPLSYLHVIQSIADQVKSGGRNRRAANLVSYSCYHPDAFRITKCKNDKQSFHAMNLSMLVDNNFMRHVDDDDMKTTQVSPKNGPTGKMFHINELWNTIVDQAWNNGDPGLLFYDRINKDNPTPSLGDIRTSNPCGEVVGMPWTACVLGHWNLNKFLYFDYRVKDLMIDRERIDEHIYWGVLFLNKIIDKTAQPNDKFHEMMQKLRPIGMGFMGLADVLFKLRIPYGSEEAQQFVDRLQHFLTKRAFEWSKFLAEEGICPKVDIPPEDKQYFYEFLENFGVEPSLIISNTQVTCIAPTGSTSISADCSYGFEPHMALVWSKKLSDSDDVMHFFDQEFKDECESRDIPLTEHLVNEIKNNKGSIRGINDFPKDMQEVFVTAHDLNWKDRINMQAAAQKWITMSISSTVNLPNSATKDDVSNVYQYAWQQGLKGITIFRDGCLDSQPVNFGGDCSEAKETATESKPTKRERPEALKGTTHKLKTGSGTLYLTMNELDGEPFEVFATLGKSGRTAAAKAESLGRMTSLALRSGVPIEDIINQLEGIGGDYQIFQNGMLVKSIPDAIAHILKQYKDWGNESNPVEDVKAMQEEMKSNKGYAVQEIPPVTERSGSICPKCAQPTLRRDSSCRGGECTNPDCFYSNCS